MRAVSDQMPRFPDETLARLEDAKLIQIETKRRSGRPRLTIIWVVVEGGEVFVRSVRGKSGRWYQAAVRDGEAVVHVDGSAVPVTVHEAADDDSVRRCTEALTQKYRTSRASLASMVRDDILDTTLRIEPA